MFRTIVVPADLGARNRDAVEMAGRLVAPGGTIHLVHVVETIPGLGLEEERAVYGRLEERAREHLAALAAPLEARGVEWRPRIAYGPRAETILGEAAALAAELVVVRSHRIGEGESTNGSGTLSYQLGKLAACPVLLVK